MFTIYLYLVLMAIILTILYISKELILVDLKKRKQKKQKKQKKQRLEQLKCMTKQVVKCDISSYFFPSLDQINYKSK